MKSSDFLRETGLFLIIMAVTLAALATNHPTIAKGGAIATAASIAFLVVLRAFIQWRDRYK